MNDLIFLSPNRVWRTYPGGRLLDELEGRENPADSHFPEDWIASTTKAINKGREHLVDEGISTVEIDGQKLLLSDYLKQDPIRLLGVPYHAKFGPTVAVLVKFLDAAIRLHLQCHPTIPFAKKHLDSAHGKTEAYYILRGRAENPDPYIYMAFQNPPAPREFKKMIEAQDIGAIEACFEKIPVQPGDVYIVPGGIPHAIGEGVLMVEIMEPSDWVVRIEFEKAGYRLPEEARFMGRDIDFGLSVFDYTAYSKEEVKRLFSPKPVPLNVQGASHEDRLIGPEQTSCFRVNRITVQGAFVDDNEDEFYIGIVTKGEGVAEWNGASAPVAFPTRFFKPSALKKVRFSSEGGELEIVKIYPPT